MLRENMRGSIGMFCRGRWPDAGKATIRRFRRLTQIKDKKLNITTEFTETPTDVFSCVLRRKKGKRLKVKG